MKTSWLLCTLLCLVKADFKDDALKVHNEYRATHGVPDLALDESVNAYAQERAEHLANDVHKLVHDGKGNYGENLYYGTRGNDNSYLAVHAVHSWYSEKSTYDYDRCKSTSGNVTGHFTQVVWKNSKTVGIGIAYDSIDSSIGYVVANYYPPGNYRGAYQENVLTPRKGESSGMNHCSNFLQWTLPLFASGLLK